VEEFTINYQGSMKGERVGGEGRGGGVGQKKDRKMRRKDGEIS